MSVLLTPKEEDCFNFHWKIKNFSYCSESIGSPEFTYDGDVCSLIINPEFMQCQLLNLTQNTYEKFPRIKYLLSFLPCDGSRPLTADTMCLEVSKEILFRTRRSSFLPDDTLTVHFQFSNDSERGKFLVQSQVGVKRKCFLWTMPNFIDQHHNNDFEINAESTDRFGTVDMRLKSVDGINSDELFYIEISLDKGGGECYCVLEVTVLDVDGKAENCVSGQFLFQPEYTLQKWKFPHVIKRSKLIACPDRLMPGGTLSLKCNFAITMGTITEETSVLSYFGDVTPLLTESEDISKCFRQKSSSDSAADLKSHLEKIMDNKAFCDVILKVAGSDEIQAHMNILGARSPVFQSMFKRDMAEHNDTFVIEDLDIDTLYSLLLYIYTDTIHDSNWKHIKKLYSAANKYQVQGLKQKCSSFLKSRFAISNICEALSLADLHEDADLETAALDFISKYDLEVFASRKWKDIEKNNCSLALRALRQICFQKSLD